MGITVLKLHGQFIVTCIPVDHEHAGKELFSEDALGDRGGTGVLEEKDAQCRRIEEPGKAVLSVVSLARLISMLRLILPVRLLQGVDHRLEVPAQAVRKINEAAEVTPVIAEILPMGTLLEVMHHGGLRADMVAVEAAGKDGGFSRELLLAVRAHAVVQAVEDPLRFPGSAVDDRPVCLFSYRDEHRPTVGTGVGRIPVDDGIGRCFRNGYPAVAGVAGGCPSLFVRLLFGGILFKGYL